MKKLVVVIVEPAVVEVSGVVLVEVELAVVELDAVVLGVVRASKQSSEVGFLRVAKVQQLTH